MPRSDNRHGQFVRPIFLRMFLMCTSMRFEFVLKTSCKNFDVRSPCIELLNSNTSLRVKIFSK